MIYNVLEMLEKDVRERPGAVAFGDPDGVITYGELKKKADAAATFLIPKLHAAGGRTVTHGCEPVAFYLEKSCTAMAGMLGAVSARGFYSVLDPRQPSVRTEKILETLSPKVLLTDEANEEKARALQFSGEIFRLDALFSTAPDEELLAAVRAEALDTDPLYVNFTSGSTGLPKGVAVCHRSVIEFIDHFTRIFGIREDDILANQAPFDFDVSVKDIYSGLMAGARVQLIPREYFSSPTVLMDYLSVKKATVLIWAVSAMCFVSIMNGLDYRTPETVRLVMFSGEVMPVKQLKIWQKYLPDAVYVNLYGPTEITCNCTYYILDRAFEGTDVIPAGRPFPNEKVFLLGDDDREVTEKEQQGEICVCGTCLALGYYRDAERTAAAFMPNPLNHDFTEMMYRTGDIGKYDADGLLIYVSRKDFQIKHLGHRIELGEIENNAMAAEGVSRACCLYDADRKRLLLFYTGGRDKTELMHELRTTLPQFMLPNALYPLEEMPMTKNGKIDRKQLEEAYKAGRH